MNELAKIDPHSNVEAYRASTEAAALCKEIVARTASEIQKRKYVSVEGWQAIARAHGCAAGARDVEWVDGGVRAIGEIRDIQTGALIAVAEGFVGEDEPTWFGGEAEVWDKQARQKVKKILPKRADYAIRAMAQTRAMSRACRSAFAHVVVMMDAGLQTTPAEEVPTGGFDRETGEIIETTPERPPIPGIHKIKGSLRQLMIDGNKAEDLETFDALVAKYQTELDTIRDGNHEFWTGDGGDSAGYKAWIDYRREELTPQAESLTFQLVMSTLETCETSAELQSWLGMHGDAVDGLDGEERRRFESAYNSKEVDIMERRAEEVGAK